MKRPVRTTLIAAFLGGFVVYPFLHIWFMPLLGWPLAPKLILWSLVTVYAFFLARLSGTGARAVLFPLGLLLGAALWPYVYSGYFAMLLGVFGWIRSGICFSQRPVRALAAELVTLVGGIALVGLWSPGGTLQWGLAIWWFGLIQCLYFFITGLGAADAADKDAVDPFEAARRELERVLSRPS